MLYKNFYLLNHIAFKIFCYVAIGNGLGLQSDLYNRQVRKRKRQQRQQKDGKEKATS